MLVLVCNLLGKCRAGRHLFVSSKTVSKLGMRISRALSVMRMSGQLSVGSQISSDFERLPFV